MSSVAFRVESPALAAAVARLGGLHAALMADLPATLGAIAESGARERVAETKAGPDGAPWAPWSPPYAESRTRAKSLLVDSGALLDSLAFETRGPEVAVGASPVYAAIHQFGGAEVGKPGLPARPYLGVSQAEAQAMAEAIEAFVGRVLGGAR